MTMDDTGADLEHAQPSRVASAGQAKAPLRLAALVLAAVAIQGCAVQLASPYSAQIARDADAFLERFVGFAADMRAKAGTPAGTAAANAAAYNEMKPQLVAMQAKSELLVGGVDCLSLARRVTPPIREQFPEIDDALAKGAAPDDRGSCQTRLIVLIQEQLMDLNTLHRQRCDAGAPGGGCAMLWGPSYAFGILRTAPDSGTGRPVSYVLSSTRALMFSQEVKADAAKKQED